MLACFNSSSSNFQFDAGELETPDAGSPVYDATTTPDGSMPTTVPEAGPDAPPDVVEEPAPPTTVQVLVIDASGPEMGVTIVFDDASGNVLATAVTDALGSVVQQVAAGSQVTALLGTSDAPNLLTITGVKPGDVLKVIDGPIAPTPGEAAEITYSPFAQGDAGVAGYHATSGICGNNQDETPGEIDYGLSPGCTNSSGQFPVLLEALGTDGPLAWQGGKGSPTLDGGVSRVDFTSSSWSTTLGTETVTLLNTTPADGPYTTATEYTVTDPVSSVPISAGTDYTPGTVDAGVLQSTFAIHPGFGDFDQVEVDESAYQSGGVSQLTIADRVSATTSASPSASDTIDLNDALPAITGASIDTTNPSQPTLSWTSDTPLTGATATFVQVQFFDLLDDAGGDRKVGNWTIIVPASQMSVVPPQIPGDLGFGPSALATYNTDDYPIVLSLSADALPTYDAIRATAAQVGTSLNVDNTPLIPPLPANGRARMTMFYPTGG